MLKMAKSPSLKKPFSLAAATIFVILLTSSFSTAQDKKLRLEIESERVTVFSSDGRDSLVLTSFSTHPDSGGIYLGNELVISRTGIRLGSVWHPAASIESLTVTAYFDDTSAVKKSRALGADDKIFLAEPAVVKAGDYIKGNVIVLGADIQLNGEVSGDIITFLGDCKLGPEAVVHGDVIVIGGKIDQKDGAVVYGQLARASQEDKRSRRFYEEGQFGSFAFLGAYNRVDGFNLQVKVAYRSADQHSRLWAAGGHAFSRDRWLYDVGFSQKLFSKNHFFFGASAYRQTWSQDQWILGPLENSFATLFLRHDFMDYTEREGVATFAEQEYKDAHYLRVTYSLDQFKALDKETDWSLIRGPKFFRRNFSTLPMDTVKLYQTDFNAEISALTASYIFDTRDDPKDPDVGWLGKAEWELAGGALGSQRDYSRIMLTFERIQPLGPRQSVLVHTVYGTSIHRLPLQKLYFLGGIGTLRGYRFKEFFGDRMALLNFEYMARFIQKAPTGVLFFDIGKTSLRSGDSDFWSGSPFKSDLGIGLKFGSFLRLDLAKPLNSATPLGSSKPVRFTFRFSRNF